jgi:hypothetical protein
MGVNRLAHYFGGQEKRCARSSDEDAKGPGARNRPGEEGRPDGLVIDLCRGERTIEIVRLCLVTQQTASDYCGIFAWGNGKTA